jgi:hypothetical protein
MPGQLGIRFKPDEQQAAMGKRQGSKEGVQRAIQMLSLRYPKFSNSNSPVGDPALLAGNGAPRLSGFNPDAAILQAMIRALSGGGASVSAPIGSPLAPTPQGRMGSAPRTVAKPTRAQTAPSFTPGVDTYGVPPPSGAVSKQWSPQVSEPLRQVSGDVAGAATRSSSGYRTALTDKYDYLGGRRGSIL